MSKHFIDCKVREWIHIQINDFNNSISMSFRRGTKFKAVMDGEKITLLRKGMTLKLNVDKEEFDKHFVVLEN